MSRSQVPIGAAFGIMTGVARFDEAPATFKLLSREPPWIHFTRADPVLPEDLADAEVCLYNIDCDQIRAFDDFYRSFEAALDLATYPPSLADFLDELYGVTERGIAFVLVLNRALGLWQESPETMTAIVETWNVAAWEWWRDETPFHLVVQMTTGPDRFP